jgi:DNA polymerase II small subunit/DNA polymerase delta subunit B
MKEKIVRQFLKEGVLLSPETLEKITETYLEHMLEKGKKSKSFVFSFQDEKPEKPEMAIEVRKLQKRVKLQPQDFAKYYNTRFEGLRDILLKKMEDVVSVANAKKSGSAIATIGMVREQTQRGFIIEDTTGNAEAISKNEDVGIDDVIGVKGAVKEEKLFAEEIIWPDISMSHKHHRPDFTLTLSEKAEHKDGILITPEAVHGFDKKKTPLPNPGWITISKDSLTVTVLVYKPDKKATQKEVLAWLKKRHLCPDKNQIRGTDDPFLIDTIPDVLWIVSDERWNDIYKTAIIVSSDGKVPAEVNLATGKVVFQD